MQIYLHTFFKIKYKNTITYIYMCICIFPLNDKIFFNKFIKFPKICHCVTLSNKTLIPIDKQIFFFPTLISICHTHLVYFSKLTLTIV